MSYWCAARRASRLLMGLRLSFLKRAESMSERSSGKRLKRRCMQPTNSRGASPLCRHGRRSWTLRPGFRVLKRSSWKRKRQGKQDAADIVRNALAEGRPGSQCHILGAFRMSESYSAPRSIMKGSHIAQIFVCSKQGWSMATQAEIQEQQALLDAHRHTLSIYLRQRALQGQAFAPPSIENGINEARNNIRNIKKTLRSWAALVEDRPDDEEQSSTDALDDTGGRQGMSILSIIGLLIFFVGFALFGYVILS